MNTNLEEIRAWQTINKLVRVTAAIESAPARSRTANCRGRRSSPESHSAHPLYIIFHTYLVSYPSPSFVLSPTRGHVTGRPDATPRRGRPRYTRVPRFDLYPCRSRVSAASSLLFGRRAISLYGDRQTVINRPINV